MEWKDATTYAQGQRGVRAPDAWEASVGGVTIRVSCGHICHRPAWVMFCHDLDIRERKVVAPEGPEGAEIAQIDAIRFAALVAEEKADRLSAFAATARRLA